MFITIAVIAYNEENTIKNILDDISRQDYDHNLMEVVLVDSASTDGTKAVMQKFADENKMGARQIVVLDNPKKTLPCGWNVLLDNYAGEAVIRVDAHAHIPVAFVSKNVKVLEEGEMEPFIEEVEKFAKGKNIALFGSYGWGDGEWMREWEKRVTDAGAKLANESVIVNDSPDEDAVTACNGLGKIVATL